MSKIQIGGSQITWRSVLGKNYSEEQALQEIAHAGYEGAPTTFVEGRSAQETVKLFSDHGLKPAPGYFGAAFWDPDQESLILERARGLATFTRDVGCAELYVAAGGPYTTRGGKSRGQVAGHVSPEDSMTDDEFKQMASTLNGFGEITLSEGVRICFHNHVGTVVETEEELEKLLSLVDPDRVFLGPDTGHLAWAGGDIVEFCRRHAAQIKTMHLKDISGDIRERGHDEKWDYPTFTRNGIFTELGEGVVDFPAIMEILEQAGFEGWLIVETDVTQQPTALASANISRTYLHRIGV